MKDFLFKEAGYRLIGAALEVYNVQGHHLAITGKKVGYLINLLVIHSRWSLFSCRMQAVRIAAILAALPERKVLLRELCAFARE